MRLDELFAPINELGLVVPHVNTTVDVGPDAIKKQAAKFGIVVSNNGEPPLARPDGRNVFETPEHLVIKDEMRNFHHDQYDMTLTASMDGEVVGFIDYSVYRGVPQIQMIKVARQREGIGTALIQQLQRKYPDVEIDWGFTTPMGTEFKKALKTVKVDHPDIIEKQKRLDDLKAKLKHYEKIVSDWQKAGSDPAKRDEINAQVDDWNDVADEVLRLEREIGNQKTHTTLVKTESHRLREYSSDEPRFGGGEDGYSEEQLKKFAARWWTNDEDPKVAKLLAMSGWEIGQDEGNYDNGGVFVVQSGDINGDSYLSWPAEELEEMNETFDNQNGSKSLLTDPGTKKWQKMKKDAVPGTEEWFKTWYSRPYLTNGTKND